MNLKLNRSAFLQWLFYDWKFNVICPVVNEHVRNFEMGSPNYDGREGSSVTFPSAGSWIPFMILNQYCYYFLSVVQVFDYFEASLSADLIQGVNINYGSRGDKWGEE